MTLYSYLASRCFVWKCFLFKSKCSKANRGPAGFIAGILNKHMWENTKAWYCNTPFENRLWCISVLLRGYLHLNVRGGLHCFIRWKQSTRYSAEHTWLLFDFYVSERISPTWLIKVHWEILIFLYFLFNVRVCQPFLFWRFHLVDQSE